jgi:hypothetical protein
MIKMSVLYRTSTLIVGFIVTFIVSHLQLSAGRKIAQSKGGQSVRTPSQPFFAVLF